MITNDTRKEIAQAVAKAIAYKNCNKQQDAEAWARRLVQLLECEGILHNGDIECDADCDNDSAEYAAQWGDR